MRKLIRGAVLIHYHSRFFRLNCTLVSVLLLLDVKFFGCCVVDCELYFIGEKNAHWNGLVDLADRSKQQL